jgi:hypothetical protein
MATPPPGSAGSGRMPIAANTSFDLYRAGAVPPADPTVAGLAGFLAIALPRALAVARRVDAWQRFTHRLLVGLDVDVRDLFDGGNLAAGSPDSVFIPDRTGVRYRVVFVERRMRGTAFDHLCVYLSRSGA